MKQFKRGAALLLALCLMLNQCVLTVFADPTLPALDPQPTYTAKVIDKVLGTDTDDEVGNIQTIHRNDEITFALSVSGERNDAVAPGTPAAYRGVYTVVNYNSAALEYVPNSLMAGSGFATDGVTSEAFTLVTSGSDLTTDGTLKFTAIHSANQASGTVYATFRLRVSDTAVTGVYPIRITTSDVTGYDDMTGETTLSGTNAGMDLDAIDATPAANDWTHNDRVRIVTITPPTAEDLVSTGEPQLLLKTPGQTEDGGKMEYYLSTSPTTPTGGEWGTAIPEGTDPDTYYIFYRSDAEPGVIYGPITVRIVPNIYTVTWKVYNGNVLQSGTVAQGDKPVYTGLTPSRPATAKYSYTFVGWATKDDQTSGKAMADLPAVTEDVTYYAAFSRTVNTYTVRWENDNGAVLEIDRGQLYGTTPTYDGAAPTKAPTVDYSYTFAGWTPMIAPVEDDTIYTAKYDQVLSNYTVTLDPVSYIYDSTANTPSITVSRDDTGVVPTSDYTVSYEDNVDAGIATVTVTLNNGKTITKSFTIERRDASAAAITFPSTDGYAAEAQLWRFNDAVEPDPTITLNIPGVGDVTLVRDRDYTIEYSNNIDVSAGTATVNVTYIGNYKNAGARTFDIVLPQYTVRFVDVNGTTSIIAPAKYNYDTAGNAVAMPNAADVTGKTGDDGDWVAYAVANTDAEYTYTFANGWTDGTKVYPLAGPVATVTQDVTYEPAFLIELNRYTLTFLDEDDEVIETRTVFYGETPEVNDPVKAGYSFTGWETGCVKYMTLPKVTGDATYKATFGTHVTYYTVRFEDAYGNELQSGRVVSGTMPIPPAPPKLDSVTLTNGSGSRTYDYNFAGWKDVNTAAVLSPAAADTTYRAVYTDSVSGANVTVTTDTSEETTVSGGTTTVNGVTTTTVTSTESVTAGGHTTEKTMTESTVVTSLAITNTAAAMTYKVTLTETTTTTYTESVDGVVTVNETNTETERRKLDVTISAVAATTFVNPGAADQIAGGFASKTTHQYTLDNMNMTKFLKDVLAAYDHNRNYRKDTSAGAGENDTKLNIVVNLRLDTQLKATVEDGAGKVKELTYSVEPYQTATINGIAQAQRVIGNDQLDPTKAINLHFPVPDANFSPFKGKHIRVTHKSDAAVYADELNFRVVQQDSIDNHYYVVEPVTHFSDFKIEADGNCYVQVDNNDGSAVTTVPVVYNTAMGAPANPTRAGYTFSGWTLGGAPYNFATPVTNDMTLVATWTYAGGGGGGATPPKKDDKDTGGPVSPSVSGVDRLLNTDDHILFIRGYADGSVQPEGNITRAETAMMLYRLLRNQNVAITQDFSDVADGAWYAEAVRKLASMGVILGYEDGTFLPDKAITRAEFTAMAARFAYATEGKMYFSDVGDGHWAYQQIIAASTYGWIEGYEDETFRPQNAITRAEAAAVLNRMLGRKADMPYAMAHEDELVYFFDLRKDKWYYADMVEATNGHDHEGENSTEVWKKIRH